MVGNVREWTSTLWGKRLLAPDPELSYPWVEDDGRDDLKAGSHILRVYRGGDKKDGPADLRCSARAALKPGSSGGPDSRGHGFRVMLSIPW
jgi:formylglycine-generating enzyme required for sulfatase activity